jgi:hypothetical protein
MISMLAATATELTKLKPVWRGLLILGRNVVAALTSLTLKNNIISRHNFLNPILYAFVSGQLSVVSGRTVKLRTTDH